MIQVDISNIWGKLSLQDLLGLERSLFDTHNELTEQKHPLLQLPREEEAPQQAIWAEEILESSQVLVVLGDEGFAEGVVELFGTGGIPIIFARGSFSERSWNQLQDQLYGKSFSLCLGSQIPDSRLLRELKWLLDRRYGTDEAWARVHRDPYGLITLAAAGLDVKKLQAGMAQAQKALELRSFENPAWLYAAARHLLVSRGIRIERLVYDEPGFEDLSHWWQGLFRGMLPRTEADMLPVLAATDGSMDTLLRFYPEKPAPEPGQPLVNPEWASFLASVNFIPQEEYRQLDAVLEADTKADIPAVIIDCGEPEEYTLGWLYRFFRLSAALCSRLSGQTG